MDFKVFNSDVFVTIRALSCPSPTSYFMLWMGHFRDLNLTVLASDGLIRTFFLMFFKLILSEFVVTEFTFYIRFTLFFVLLKLGFINPF